MRKFKKNKKKKFTPQPLSKFAGDNKVKVFTEFLHFGLVELKRERTVNWEKKFKFGKLIITCGGPESINMYDKGVLLALIKMFSDYEKNLKRFKVDNKKQNLNSIESYLLKNSPPYKIRKPFADYIEDMWLFRSVSIPFNDFCRKYVRASRAARKNIIDSLERLLKINIFYRNGNVEFKNYRFLDYFVLNSDGTAEFTISKQFLDSCASGLLVDVDVFFSLKTEIARALYLFFISNKGYTIKNEGLSQQGYTISFTTLKWALGLTDDDCSTRKLLIHGLESLKTAKIISDFSIQQRESDVFFVIKYSRKSVNDDTKSVNDDTKSVNDDTKSVNDDTKPSKIPE